MKNKRIKLIAGTAILAAFGIGFHKEKNGLVSKNSILVGNEKISMKNVKDVSEDIKTASDGTKTEKAST